MEKKPGATRVAFIIVPFAFVIFGFVVCLFAWKADSSGLEKLAYLAAGAISNAIGFVTAYLFSKGE